MLFGEKRLYVKKKIGGKKIQIDLRVPKDDDFEKLKENNLSLKDVLKIIYEALEEREDLIPKKKLVLTLCSEVDYKGGEYHPKISRPEIPIVSMGIKILLSNKSDWKEYLIHELTHHKDYSSVLFTEFFGKRFYDEEGEQDLDKMKVTEKYRNNCYVAFLNLLEVLGTIKAEGIARLSQLISKEEIHLVGSINGKTWYTAYSKIEKGTPPFREDQMRGTGLILMVLLTIYLLKEEGKEDLIEISMPPAMEEASIGTFLGWYRCRKWLNKAPKKYGKVTDVKLKLKKGFEEFCKEEVIPLATEKNFFEFLKLMDEMFEELDLEDNPLSYELYSKRKDQIWERYQEYCEEEGIEEPLEREELFHLEDWHEAMLQSAP